MWERSLTRLTRHARARRVLVQIDVAFVYGELLNRVCVKERK